MEKVKVVLPDGSIRHLSPDSAALVKQARESHLAWSEIVKVSPEFQALVDRVQELTSREVECVFGQVADQCVRTGDYDVQDIVAGFGMGPIIDGNHPIVKK